MGDFTAIIYLLLIAFLVVWLTRVRGRERETAQKLEKTQRERKAVYHFLDSLGERLTKDTLALEPTLQIITEFIVEATEAEAGAAYILDPDDNHLSAKVVHGMFPVLLPSTGYVLTKQRYLTERVKRERIPLGSGIIGEVAETGEPVLIKDAALDPRVPRSEQPVVAIRTIMVAPLFTHGHSLGVLAVVNKRGVGSFQQEELDLLVSLADQAASTVELVKLYNDLAEKQRIEQELKVAHDFQKMLLPSSSPVIDGYSIAAFSAPALEVGGDYYDFIEIDEQKRYLGIAVADVSGKGIPGGLIMAVVRCTMRAAAPNNMSPRDVLMKVNDRVYADTKENVFVTITYGILDTWERTFRFVRAGHEPVVTVSDDEGPIRLSSPPGMAMGLVAGELFGVVEEETLQLKPGDVVVLYTDGVVEAMDNKSREYGQQRFFDLIAANRALTPEEIIENTLEDIKSFTDGHPQHDDITILALRVSDSAISAQQNSNQLSAETVGSR